MVSPLYTASLFAVAWGCFFLLVRQIGQSAAKNVVITRPFAFLATCGGLSLMAALASVSIFLGYLATR